jgi:hypothetical protein
LKDDFHKHDDHSFSVSRALATITSFCSSRHYQCIIVGCVLVHALAVMVDMKRECDARFSNSTKAIASVHIHILCLQQAIMIVGGV